jgi:hypothetical protein
MSEYDTLPTGKQHVSFSEISDWVSCSYRHKRKFVDKIDLGRPGAAMDFGTACHASCEDFLPTRMMNVSIAHEVIRKAWEAHVGVEGFNQQTLDAALLDASNILPEIPVFMDKTFPGWEFIDAEHQLYEPIEGQPHAFKGYIDAIIRAKGPRGNNLVWLLDWKTSARGWFKYKRQDEKTKMQLVFYKNFWSKKLDVDPKDVRAGFVILKRNAKPGDHCELFSLSIGPKPTQRSLKVINNMVSSVKRGVAIKNREECKYCDYHDTEFCT